MMHRVYTETPGHAANAALHHAPRKYELWITSISIPLKEGPLPTIGVFMGTCVIRDSPCGQHAALARLGGAVTHSNTARM